MRQKWIWLSVWLVAVSVRAEVEQVSMEHPDIHIYGAIKTSSSDRHLNLHRFPRRVLDEASTQTWPGYTPERAGTLSGASVAFVTDSPEIRLRVVFDSLEGAVTTFAVYGGGVFLTNFTIDAGAEAQDLEWKNPSTNGMTLFEVTLPSLRSAALGGLWLDGSANMLNPFPEGRPLLAVIGDSIAHGVPPDAADETWPWLLSRKLGLGLVNLSLAGGGVSELPAKALAAYKNVSVVVVLLGYNDWQFFGVEGLADRYEQMLLAIRRAAPDARIYCVTPTYSRLTISEKSGVKLYDVRGMIRDAVKSASGAASGLWLVSGEDVSSAVNLKADQMNDPVHFSRSGAELFAEKLAVMIGTGVDR